MDRSPGIAAIGRHSKSSIGQFEFSPPGVSRRCAADQNVGVVDRELRVDWSGSIGAVVGDRFDQSEGPAFLSG